MEKFFNGAHQLLFYSAWFTMSASANINSRRDIVPATPELVVQRLGGVIKKEVAKVDQVKTSLEDRHVRSLDFIQKAQRNQWKFCTASSASFFHYQTISLAAE